MHGPRRIRARAALPLAVTMVAIVKVSSIHFILSIHFLLLDTSYDVLGNSEDTSSNKSAVQKSDFRILKTIGRGTYGKEYLVQHNQTE